MKKFLYNTVIGGVFFLIPLFVLLKITIVIVTFFKNLGPNIVKFLGFGQLAGYAASSFTAVVLIVLLCFLFGLLARWSLASKFKFWFENKIVKVFPFYDYYKAIIEQSLKVKEQESREVFLIKNENTWRIGVLMETLPNNKICVFIPFSPKVTDGEVVVVSLETVVSIGYKEKEITTMLLQKGEGFSTLEFPDL